jgi:hypothetical protein
VYEAFTCKSGTFLLFFEGLCIYISIRLLNLFLCLDYEIYDNSGQTLNNKNNSRGLEKKVLKVLHAGEIHFGMVL